MIPTDRMHQRQHEALETYAAFAALADAAHRRGETAADELAASIRRSEKLYHKAHRAALIDALAETYGEYSPEVLALLR